MEEKALSVKKEGSMSIAERRAAWRGIERPILPPRVNTARFRTNGGAFSPVASSPATAMRSPCLVIPPGISPAALLDSPVLFQIQSNNPTGNWASSTGLSQDNLTVSELPEKNNSNSIKLEPDKIEDSSSTIACTSQKKSLEDGYNWRKYGQKLVKGCEFPRNYYKCTYLNCNVKKMVEQSIEGRVTDIVYKGNHEHPLPDSSNLKICNQRGYMSKRCAKMNGNSLEGNSSVSSVSEACENGKDRNVLGVDDSMSCVERSGLCCNVEDDDEREAKRRRNEGYLTNIVPASETNREPRVVVQTVSEIDLLDDGYKWRKYGQKVVKGNPNPRSYYKCTNLGCPVRKHIERAPHDLESVITTYEGKHNHEIPVTNISNTNNHKAPNSNNSNNIQVNDFNPSAARISMQPNGSYEGVCLGSNLNLNLNMLRDFHNSTYLELFRPLFDQAFVGSNVAEYRENPHDEYQ